MSSDLHFTVHGLLESFLASWAVSIVCGFSTRNLMGGVLMLLFAFFFRYAQELPAREDTEEEKAGKAGLLRLPPVYEITSLFLSFLVILHGRKRYTEGFDSMLFKAAVLLITFLGMFFLIRTLLAFADRKLLFKEDLFRGTVSWTPRRVFAAVFLACAIVYLPCFLYEYPGIISPDGLNQIEQVTGFKPWSNHHPIAHTLVIGLFYKIGSIFTDSMNGAVSFYTVFQFLFMSACAACVVTTLRNSGFQRRVLIPAAVFYALLPFQAVFAVYILKDTFFSGIFMLFTCILLNMTSEYRRGAIAVKTLVLFFVLSLCLCLFRSNGWYAFLVMIPFLLLVFRKAWKKLLPVLACTVLCAFILRGPVMDRAGVVQPDFIESCCVPLQQIARVIVDGKQIPEEDLDLIGKVIRTEEVPALYDAGFADNMKELVRAGDQEYLTAHKADFFRLWLRLGLSHPDSYFNAWADLTEGYWFPDLSYDTATIDGVFPNDIGLYWDPVLRGKAVVKAKEILLKLGDFVPVYALLWSCGTYSWLLVISAAFLIRKKKGRQYLVVLLPSFAILFTLFLATPVSTEFRYALPVVTTLPLWLMLPWLD